MIWIYAISLVFLLLIVISDIKTRQVQILYLLGETIASVCLSYNQIGISIIRNTVTNFGIIVFQILILWGWILIKGGKPANGLWSKFGKGDLFMLAVSAINFSVLNYLLFTIFVSLISIIIWLGLGMIYKIKSQTIPFAAYIAAGIIIIRIFQITGLGAFCYSDNILINLIYGIY